MKRRPAVIIGWHKEDNQQIRRSQLLRRKKGNLLAIANALKTLARNVTDAETKRKATSDARYFFELHKKKLRQLKKRC